jgi:pimeloyl-ACP methyl ester carboxylesterase
MPETLILWGEQDKFLGKELAEKSLEVCRDGRLIFYPNATHWLQIDEADAVNQELESFFGD